MDCEFVEKRKPADIREYIQWLHQVHKITIDEHYEAYYRSVVSTLQSELEKSKFWRELVDNLSEYDEEYQLEYGYPLFARKLEAEILTKTFDSFLLKTFRKNILENKSWPNEPDDGWILSDDWFCKINDIVRTLLVVKYLDGVNFIKNRISSFCETQGLICEATYEAREEGYYALHLYTKRKVEI
jgi:hypothetical protein